MRVAVTGGTGFVGSHTVAGFVRAGHDVRVLARTPSKLAIALGPLGVDADRVEIVEGDVTSPEDVRRLLDGADACLHAAAVVATCAHR